MTGFESLLRSAHSLDLDLFPPPPLPPLPPPPRCFLPGFDFLLASTRTLFIVLVEAPPAELEFATGVTTWKEDISFNEALVMNLEEEEEASADEGRLEPPPAASSTLE